MLYQSCIFRWLIWVNCSIFGILDQKTCFKPFWAFFVDFRLKSGFLVVFELVYTETVYYALGSFIMSIQLKIRSRRQRKSFFRCQTGQQNKKKIEKIVFVRSRILELWYHDEDGKSQINITISPDFIKYFFLKFDSISNKKKFEKNHSRGKKSKNSFLENFFLKKTGIFWWFLGFNISVF